MTVSFKKEPLRVQRKLYLWGNIQPNPDKHRIWPTRMRNRRKTREMLETFFLTWGITLWEESSNEKRGQREERDIGQLFFCYNIYFFAIYFLVTNFRIYALNSVTWPGIVVPVVIHMNPCNNFFSWLKNALEHSFFSDRLHHELSSF